MILYAEKKVQRIYFKETDSERATLTDIFCNTNGFSAKTVQAIYKETLYKVSEFLLQQHSVNVQCKFFFKGWRETKELQLEEGYGGLRR